MQNGKTTFIASLRRSHPHIAARLSCPLFPVTRRYTFYFIRAFIIHTSSLLMFLRCIIFSLTLCFLFFSFSSHPCISFHLLPCQLRLISSALPLHSSTPLLCIPPLRHSTVLPHLSLSPDRPHPLSFSAVQYFLPQHITHLFIPQQYVSPKNSFE